MKGYRTPVRLQYEQSPHRTDRSGVGFFRSCGIVSHAKHLRDSLDDDERSKFNLGRQGETNVGQAIASLDDDEVMNLPNWEVGPE